jgi:hypothetical protein
MLCILGKRRQRSAVKEGGERISQAYAGQECEGVVSSVDGCVIRLSQYGVETLLGMLSALGGFLRSAKQSSLIEEREW